MWREIREYISSMHQPAQSRGLSSTEAARSTFRALLSPTGKLPYEALRNLVAQTTPELFREIVGYPFLLGWGVREGEVVPKQAFSRSAKRRSTMLFRPQRIFEEMQERRAIRSIVYALAAPAGGDFREQTIGSSAECTIVLPDFAVSGRHAVMTYRKGRYVLVDCRSTNGTFVNARRIGTEGRTLEDGDLLTFGRYHFVFAYPESLHRHIERRSTPSDGE
jgi:hypothetical protein